MNSTDIWTARAGRALIAVLFAGGAVQKIIDPAPAAQMLASIGLPPVLIWPVAGFNLVVAVMLVMGIGLRLLGYTLAAYCVATSYFHLVPNDAWQISIMVKNWAIGGGLLILASQSRRAD